MQHLVLPLRPLHLAQLLLAFLQRFLGRLLSRRRWTPEPLCWHHTRARICISISISISICFLFFFFFGDGDGRDFLCEDLAVSLFGVELFVPKE